MKLNTCRTAYKYVISFVKICLKTTTWSLLIEVKIKNTRLIFPEQTRRLPTWLINFINESYIAPGFNTYIAPGFNNLNFGYIIL